MTFEEGTVSEGTLKPEDLIPVLADEYERLSGDTGKVRLFHKHVKEYHERTCHLNSFAHYCWMDSLQWDLGELFDLLNGIAPEGYYFGAHEGDGADFGFWKTEEEVGT